MTVVYSLLDPFERRAPVDETTVLAAVPQQLSPYLPTVVGTYTYSLSDAAQLAEEQSSQNCEQTAAAERKWVLRPKFIAGVLSLIATITATVSTSMWQDYKNGLKPAADFDVAAARVVATDIALTQAPHAQARKIRDSASVATGEMVSQQAAVDTGSSAPMFIDARRVVVRQKEFLQAVEQSGRRSRTAQIALLRVEAAQQYLQQRILAASTESPVTWIISSLIQ